MKKVYKNYNVEIRSEKNLHDQEIALGVGQLKKSKKTFYFETCKPKQRSENPLVFSGSYFRVRSSKSGFRFLAVIPHTDFEKLDKERISFEIEEAITNIHASYANC